MAKYTPLGTPPSGWTEVPGGLSDVQLDTTLRAIDATPGAKLDDLVAPDDNTDLNASTSAHGLLLKATAPASGLQNVVGIANGETAYTNKALFDTTNPAALGTVGPGTSLIAARRDHVHANPAIDTLAAATDITTLDASTSAHGLVVKATAPASGLVSYVGIGNGETAYTNKALFDTTNPANLNGTAAPGTSLIAARRDHVHAIPDGWNVLVKSANQDITNAGVTDDTHLQFSCTASVTYSVIADLIVSGDNATGDHIWDFAVAAGTMKGRGTCQNLTAADAIQNIIVTVSAAANTTAIVTGTAADIALPIAVHVNFAFTPSNTTTFKLRFGNSAPAGGRISRNWKGSAMYWKSLA